MTFKIARKSLKLCTLSFRYSVLVWNFLLPSQVRVHYTACDDVKIRWQVLKLTNTCSDNRFRNVHQIHFSRQILFDFIQISVISLARETPKKSERILIENDILANANYTCCAHFSFRWSFLPSFMCIWRFFTHTCTPLSLPMYSTLGVLLDLALFLPNVSLCALDVDDDDNKKIYYFEKQI